jgi:hypothetical protein
MIDFFSNVAHPYGIAITQIVFLAKDAELGS